MDAIREDELQGVRLFKSVDLASIRGIIDACTVQTWERGAVLINKGETNHTVYFILDGHVSVHLDSIQDKPLAILGPGESVAEMSVIDGQPTTAFLVAAEQIRLLAMDEDALWSLIHSSHAAACNLISTITARLRHADAAITEVTEAAEYRGYGTIDALTGLHNRYWLEQVVEHQVHRCISDEKPMCAILIDIDSFKAFNERYGHTYGDHVLYSVANTLSDNLRPAEIIARYEGDEFAVLLPKVDSEMAWRIAERIHREVMGAVPAMPDGSNIPHPTISIGVAALQPGETGKQLLAAVSEALSRSRNSGGNCISE